MKDISHSGWFHFVLLLVWLAIGMGLRFTHLASKPPWSDEFSTLVFSLGNSFRPVPLARTKLFPIEDGLGAALANCWDAANLAAQTTLGWTARQLSLLHALKAKGKKAVALILLMGFIGGITVVSNFGYQKPDRPDLLVPIIQKVSQVPVLITAAQKTHEQIGEMMSLGLEFKRTYSSLELAATGSRMNSPLFLLVHQEPDSSPSINAL